MHLQPGGIDVFYIDESHDNRVYVTTAVRIPFLRPIDGQWTIVWGDYLGKAKAWRHRIKKEHNIPVARELHGVKLASGRGNYLKGKHNFDKPKATSVYRDIIADIDFIPEGSIISVTALRGTSYLYGRDRIEASMYALFQRMRLQCLTSRTNAITFFDQGHPEYRTLYRQAQVYLPTGSRLGGWESGPTQNLPLDMFTKDANEKNSRDCYFTQTADLIAYAAFLKIKGEKGGLTEWQRKYSLENLYDSVPTRALNTRASPSGDAIKRLFK